MTKTTIRNRIGRALRRWAERIDPPIEGYDDDFCTCEMCRSRHAIEDMISTDDGCDICPKCWAEAQEHFRACPHQWTATYDSHGDPAHVCEKCSFIVCDDDFPSVIGAPAPERPMEDAL